MLTVIEKQILIKKKSLTNSRNIPFSILSYSCYMDAQSSIMPCRLLILFLFFFFLDFSHLPHKKIFLYI